MSGNETDVADCQWIQHLHACGLLRGSFRPDDEICAIRSLWRHRDNLIELATIHLQHMQKAFDQINVQLYNVISDLAGTTGLARRSARRQFPQNRTGIFRFRLEKSVPDASPCLFWCAFE